MSKPPAEAQLIDDIRKHYDTLSRYHHLLWGPHIHHGYWEGDETPGEAQVKLIERLAAHLRIAPEHHVLDIGFGLGGSACWMAKTFGCTVLGLTLGPVQAKAAQKRAVEEGVDDLVSFKVHGASKLDLPSETFDRICIIECSEHVRDKQAFFNDCARLLRPGGRLGLCAWLRGGTNRPEHEELVAEICEAMLCPSLLTMEEQVSMLETAGLRDVEAEDIAANVLPTWQHCRRLVRNPAVQLILRVKAGKFRRFVDAFELMERGYREGAMAYGMLTAAKD